MSVSQLIDIILINPTVHLTPSFRDTGLTASYTFQPLSNLVYTRDQQVGRVLVDCLRMRFFLLGVGVVGDLPSQHTLLSSKQTKQKQQNQR